MTTEIKLRIPYTWKNRHVFIQDRCWFGPSCTQDPPFHFSGWEHPELFSKKQPLYVEYCSGNGSWILERAKKEPGINWLAIEKRFDRAKRVWEKATKQKLTNVAVAWAEGIWLTTQFFPSASVQEIYVNFPDPWPKRRHAQHRIIAPAFVEQAARILLPGGKVTLVTDDAAYSAIMIKEMAASPHFESLHPAPYFVEATSDYGSSFFDELFRQQDKCIRLHAYVRKGA
jgi:tRNA (guanine-N7-)-methyltransferase